MNKKVLKAAFVAAIAMVSGINVFNAHKTEALSDLALPKVEALAACEITKNDNIKLKCDGEGTCSKTYLGYTLTCDGTEIK